MFQEWSRDLAVMISRGPARPDLLREETLPDILRRDCLENA